ncbi:expressed unknown protein [Seminavis robusta]|uniref:DUF4116 domain-containing protein n=1 Tax=Seminavis robusta TaxID=568900 RepID=A0A9N8DZR0_9STRA|nr:expressed unknown protein [Seminavis robusta]|eukprot:Sro508_g156660.1 n/a (412) ;mRNA; r:12230-13465
MMMNDKLRRAIKRDPFVLDKYRHYQDDETFILAAIPYPGCYGPVLRWATPRFRSDLKLVTRMAKLNWRILEYVSTELQDNRDFIVEIMSFTNNTLVLQFASPTLRDDSTLLLEGLQMASKALRYASNQLKNDKTFFLKAVQQCGSALEYASLQLQDNRDIVLAAVRQDPSSLLYASERLRGDREIVLVGVQYGWFEMLQYAARELRADRQVVLEAVASHASNLKFASEELRGDKEIALWAVSKGSYFEYLSKDIQNDLDVVYAALCNGSGYFIDVVWNKVWYCQDLKARLGDLAKAVFATNQVYNNNNNHDCDCSCLLLPMEQEAPEDYLQAWFDIIYEKRWLLRQMGNGMPREVQNQICAFADDESCWANELLACEPFISRFVLEANKGGDYDWVEFLRGCLEWARNDSP